MEIGTDIAEIERFRGRDEKFARRILGEMEFEQYSGLKSERRRAEYLAGRWAAKEAIYKATGDKGCLAYEVVNDENGKPRAIGRPGIKVSISHEAGLVVAVATFEE